MSRASRISDLALRIAAEVNALRAEAIARPTYTATTEWISTTPTPPASGVLLFARRRARRLPAFIGPTGQDAQLQPNIFSNRATMIAAANNTATNAPWYLPTFTPYTASTAVALTAASFFASLVRSKFPGASTVAATQAGFRSPALWHLSSTANKGGFFWVLRVGVAAGQSGGGRAFFGLSTTTAALANADPTALLNSIGFGWNVADTTMKVIYNDGTGTASTIDLGANFPSQNYGTYFYEFRLFAPSGGGQQVHWSATRLNDNITVSSTTPITTDLPAVDTLLATQAVYGSSVAVGAGISFDFQSLYIETDN